jgi:hypothetical protein
MAMYYFNLIDGDTVVDTDGTDLPDVGAARIHATGVARELTAHGGGILQQGWSGWTMSVHDTSTAPNCFHSPCRISGMGNQKNKPPDRSVRHRPRRRAIQ